jgi:tRNA threonylcarbamoyladenosine modification (KEOPS) complex Cgi121 subunit
MYFFEEFNFYTEITGFKNINSEQATAYLKANRQIETQSVWIQFFNSNLIATYKHLYFAVLNALYAFKNQTNLSKSLAMETLLYASAQPQIRKAIQTLGLTADMPEMAITIISDNKQQIKNTLINLSNSLHADPYDTVLKLTPKKTLQIRQVFNITSSMIEAVTKNKTATEDSALINLVIEKVALLATKL